MFKFIKNNKIFTALLTSIAVVIAATLVYAVQMNQTPPVEKDPPLIIDEGDDPLIEPGNEEPENPFTSAQIKNFYGTFNSETNLLTLKWAIFANDSIIDKVELYSQNMFIADVSYITSYEMPISVYHFATGNNEFELRLALKNELSVSEKAVVFVDYIYNVEKSHDIITNENGEHVLLLKLNYYYNTATPVGLPAISVKDANGNILEAQLADNVEQEVFTNTISAETTYAINLKDFTDTQTFTVLYAFDTVGLSYEDVVSVELNDEQLPENPEVDEENNADIEEKTE